MSPGKKKEEKERLEFSPASSSEELKPIKDQTKTNSGKTGNRENQIVSHEKGEGSLGMGHGRGSGRSGTGRWPRQRRRWLEGENIGKDWG